jgi:hypothetical protein
MINESQNNGSKETIDSLAEEIRGGKALLRVIAYPWGVEFDVCEFPTRLELER